MFLLELFISTNILHSAQKSMESPSPTGNSVFGPYRLQLNVSVASFGKQVSCLLRKFMLIRIVRLSTEFTAYEFCQA